MEQSETALFVNQGQCCCAGSRIFVEGKVYDDFVERSKVRAEKRILTNPFDMNCTQGPQVSLRE